MGKKDDKIKKLKEEVARLGESRLTVVNSYRKTLDEYRESRKEVERERIRADKSDASAGEWAALAAKYENRAKWWPITAWVLGVIVVLLIIELYFVQR